MDWRSKNDWKKNWVEGIKVGHWKKNHETIELGWEIMFLLQLLKMTLTRTMSDKSLLFPQIIVVFRLVIQVSLMWQWSWLTI